ncbi:hypothetical protein [Lacimicrobium alkaliphilum]|uniref:Peptidase n=1 Tax=Lacimicrobium alkaliphilum TaxID=1526571 RepID=A0ABQ1RDL9_9ALTE|nr:hypothetical protein [Lacimicrobium alkaliphilum]GGD64876.1 hypothetical protein GCM10011357_20260 [Lacimicrobium alkaliphilum]
MKFWRKWHKWLGLALGVQVLLWISGGVVMSVIPLDMVRGNHLVEPRQEITAAQPVVTHVDFSQWRAWEWVRRPDLLALQATDFQGHHHFLDPVTGHKLSMINAGQAKGRAQTRYLGQGNAINAKLLSQLPDEVRGRQGPLYRVDFDDWINTSFYLHPYSAEIISVRSDLWRVFDFFWMLHILDFENRTDFNNPLLISLAIAAWLFTLSGFIMLYHSLLKPNWRKLRYRVR